jgi:hypothetical protein
MHILWNLILTLGALVILVLGLASVVQDLLQRGPYEPPLIRTDGLTWPARYQGAASTERQPEEVRGTTRFAGATWSERESSQL